MTRVGVRELRQRASALLRLVEAGESVEVTDRGRPVAVLVPVPSGGPLERLRAAGDVESARGNINELPPPLVTRSSPAPSDVLARLRRDER